MPKHSKTNQQIFLVLSILQFSASVNGDKAIKTMIYGIQLVAPYAHPCDSSKPNPVKVFKLDGSLFLFVCVKIASTSSIASAAVVTISCPFCLKGA